MMVSVGHYRSILSGARTTTSWSTAFSNNCLVKGFVVRDNLKCVGIAQNNLGLVIKAVLDKSTSGSSGQNGSSEPSDPAREALERLYLQASRYEERMADPRYGSEANLELAITEMELDLNEAVKALKYKEEQLRAAEVILKQDQQDMQNTRSALYKQEKDLELARASHLQREVELRRTNKILSKQAGELKEAKLVLKQKEAEIQTGHEALTLKQNELGKSQSMLLAKDEALLKAALDLKTQDLKLQMADEVVAKQSLEIELLKKSLKENQASLMKLQREKLLKQKQLECTEADLEKRARLWIKAQEELRTLEQEFGKVKAANKELLRVKVLLTEVQGELEESLSAVEEFRTVVADQNLALAKQEERLIAQTLLLEDYETNLKSAKARLQKERDQLRAAHASYELVEQQLSEAKQLVNTLQENLQTEKSALQNSRALVNSLKSDLQKRDSYLSDIHLSLQVKEAELVSAKLEVHQVKSELESGQLTFHSKALELKAVQGTVQELQKEVSQLKVVLQYKEEQLCKMTTLLQEKDEQLSVMRIDLNDHKMQLSEVTSAVEQITALSNALVDSANRGMTTSCDEESLLMQTNVELFSANRRLLEREIQLQHFEENVKENVMWRQKVEVELEAVKECLRAKDIELQNVNEALVQKEREVKQLLCRWDARESELDKLRKEVIAKANGLTGLHTLLQKHEAIRRNSAGASAVEVLELEVGKLEVQSTLLALQNLADLSKELLERRGEQPEASIQICTSVQEEKNLGAKSIQLTTVEDLRGELEDRNAALELAKTAMEGLTRLTERLVLEAGIVVV